MPVHVLVSIWCTVKESEKEKEEKWYPVVGMSRKWGPETGRRRRRRRKERGKQNLALSEKWEKEKKQVPESDRSNERGKRTARRVIIKEGTREREEKETNSLHEEMEVVDDYLEGNEQAKRQQQQNPLTHPNNLMKVKERAKYVGRTKRHYSHLLSS